jgi:4-amino-4-deoxy-L-arabinose transferase-like glycosyltransferase
LNIKEDGFWLLLVVALLALIGIFNHSAWTPDEPRVVAISLEMSRTGNLIVPHLAGEPFLEKPPGYFMLGALSIKMFSWLFGVTGAVRFVSFLLAIGTLFFSYSLTKILYNRRIAIFATLILGTFLGFVDNTHRAIVDVGLGFFSIAAIWAFVLVFFRGKRWYCCYAALFASAAFLCKGFIGIIFIAIAWFTMVCMYIYESKKDKGNLTSLIMPHFAALVILVSICSAWMLALWHFGGKDLWYEWFMVNHVGRLTGSAAGKGHFRPEWYYYLETLSFYCLPWTPALLLSIYALIKSVLKKRCIRQDAFIGIWIVLSVIVLSISSTKRSLYIYPLLPAFAILMGTFFNNFLSSLPKWYSIYNKCFITLASIITVASVIPFFAWNIIEKQLKYTPFYPPKIISISFLSIIMTIAALIYYLRKKEYKNVVFNMSFITALAFIAILTITPYFVEGKKDMELTLKPFIDRIPIEQRSQIAGWNFSETMLSGFYMYFDWAMPQLINTDPETFAMTMDEARLRSILNGTDDEFKYVILERTKEEDIPAIVGNNNYKILVDRNKIKKYKRNLILIEGINP